MPALRASRIANQSRRFGVVSVFRDMAEVWGQTASPGLIGRAFRQDAESSQEVSSPGMDSGGDIRAFPLMLRTSVRRFLASGLAKLSLRCGRAFAVVAPDGAGLDPGSSPGTRP